VCLEKATCCSFARGQFRHGEAARLPGVACGLPVVAARGRETAAPITEAGVVLIEPGEQFGPALARVLRNPIYRESLAGRSRKAAAELFFHAGDRATVCRCAAGPGGRCAQACLIQRDACAVVPRSVDNDDV